MLFSVNLCGIFPKKNEGQFPGDAHAYINERGSYLLPSHEEY